jgi:hypothetical protein
MKNDKFIPATLLAAALTQTGVGIAGAQTTTSDVVTEQTVETDEAKPDRGERGERGDHEKRGERGGRDRGEHRGERIGFGAMLTDADANGDGSVTQDEIDLFRTSLVAGADASGDGDLSLEEFQSIYAELAQDRMEDRVTKSFERLDADSDGQVTQAEMDDRFGDIVERMDRNDDGALSEDDRKRGRDRS